MQLEQNSFKRAIAEGQPQIGFWVTLSSNMVAEVIAPAGYDWVLLDMEHSPNDYFSILGQLQAFAGTATTAIVRVEWNDPVAVKRVLDLGAPGVLFPMIQSVEEARAAVAATRYPPKGHRGVAGSTRATKFGRIPDYAHRVEAETSVLLQLETVAAVEQAAAIADVEGVDGLFFGPADIAADMGLIGKPADPAVWDLIRPVAKKLIAKGMPVGTLVLDPAFAAELLRDGFSFVASGVDSLPCTIGGTSTGFHSHKRVQTLEDFKGLKLRTAGAFAEIASRLGAVTVVIPGSEVYEALERNVIDAVEWGSPEINRSTGFQDVAKYIITPGLDLSGGSFECMFNPTAWDSLSDEDRDRIRMAAKKTLFETWVLASTSDLNAFETFVEGPNEIVRVDDAVLEKIKQVTYEWEDEIAAENPWFKKALESQRAFKAKLNLWPEYRFQIGSLGQK